ncbi:DNA replication and repair protein RecF [Aureimonas glaciei]|uniref:DNA replication and repair protein RecF n=1 Tax=Aureimonas glaciei TaxID=1776957 RepID=A0A916XSI2_9HYPH|nr:DNA replication and repair protein RecF [Aureimonas glaciei]
MTPVTFPHDDHRTPPASDPATGPEAQRGPVSVPLALPSRLTSLRLADFRNYDVLRLELDSRFTVLTGENGAGKTNLMEAVSLLTPGRGLRRAAYPEIARVGGSGGFAVQAKLLGEDGEVDIATSVRPDAAGALSRIVRINETQAKSADEMLDHLRIVWLTPAMDGLFTGPAGDRRRFLDRLVLTVDPAHGRRATDYERAMRSRNRLLSEDRGHDSWLSGIEAQMAELGLAMAIARGELVGLLQAMIAEAPADQPFPKADLLLSSGYATEDLGGPAVALEDAARERLARQRSLDRAAGRTLEGPHRADLAVTHRAKAMPAALSSTGEQKALLIGLILAHAKLVRAMSGTAPVLLLDEIAAHLDPGRRAALFDIIDGLGVQSFMTGTDASLFEALQGRAQHLRVDDGRVG